jgi:AcrR family transcriptional regulator
MASSVLLVNKQLTKSGAKRQAILDAAAKVFGAKGYANTTLGDIAAEAGTKAGSLYYYFAGRDELVEKVLEASLQITANKVIHALSELPSDVTALQRLMTCIRVHVLSALMLDIYSVAYHAVINEVPQQVKRHFIVAPRNYGKLWQDLIEKAQKAGDLREDLDPRLMRLLLFGSINWMFKWYKPGGTNSPEEILDHILTMFLTGTATPKVVAGIRRRSRAYRKPAHSRQAV